MKISKDDFEELVGQIIDIFEDNIESRTINSEEGETTAEVALHFPFDDASGVVFGGTDYDNVADAIKTTLKSWKLIEVE